MFLLPFLSFFFNGLIISVLYHSDMKEREFFKQVSGKYLLWLIAGGALVVGIGTGAGAAAVIGKDIICGTSQEGTFSGISSEYLDSEMNGISEGVPSDKGDCPGGMWVDITGAVNVPGLYCAGQGWVLGTLLDEAGGITENVCGGFVDREMNRAQLLKPNMKIYIPSSSDVECLPSEQGVLGTGGGAGTSDTVERDSLGSASQGCPDGKVNLNTASQSELENISGIGPSTAEKIIGGRPYTSADDVLNVSGIGPATLEKIRDGVCW